MQDIQIEYRQVTKRFKDRQTGQDMTAVHGVNLAIRRGEVVSLIGPSGCGKSTLLNMGSGLYQPTEGEVYVQGKRVQKTNPDVGFMLQKDLLMPWRTILKNVEFGLEIRGVSAEKRKERALQLLEKCHLSRFVEHYPHQLSGGMRQRAALARTLACDPAVLLMDEPFSALDAQTKMILQQDLARTLAEEQKTALFITHDLVEAVALSDRVFVMSERPGKIIEEIPVDIPDRDNPLQRRQHRAIGEFVSHLMSLLKVNASAEELH